MLRSFIRVAAIDPGFETRGVISLMISLQGQPTIVETKREDFYEEVLAKVAAIPGVRELHIGHSIVARSVFVGLREAVREMKALMRQAAR